METKREYIKKKYLTLNRRYRADPDNFDSSNKNRYSWRSHYGLYFDLKRICEFIKILNNHRININNKRILDVGSHHGLFANMFAYLKKTSEGIYGIDFAPDFIETAKKINPKITHIQGDIYNLPFKDNFFDLILCNYIFNSIPHEDLPKIANSISSKLKSNGYILFFEFYDAALITLINRFTLKKEGSPRFNDKKIKALFPEFRIVQSKKMMNILRSKLLELGLSYWLLDILDLILPCSFYMVLLQKKK